MRDRRVHYRVQRQNILAGNGLIDYNMIDTILNLIVT